jgi:hypothetical protein
MSENDAKEIIFKATVISDITGREDGFHHMWGYSRDVAFFKKGTVLFISRTEYEGEARYHCYTGSRHAARLSEELARTRLKATRLPGGRLAPLTEKEAKILENEQEYINFQLSR